MTGAVEGPLAAAAGGAALAVLYLAGLWAFVRRLAGRIHPGAWVLGGAALRVALVCAGLWIVSGGDALPLLAALGGFVVVRTASLAIIRRSSPGSASSGTPSAESTR